MTRVLHVIAGLQVGGAEHALLRLLGNATDVDHVAVVSILGDGPMRPDVEASGVPLVVAGSHGLTGVPAAAAALRSALRHHRPDVVQSWMYPADLLASLTATNLPVVWGVRHGHLPGVEASRATRLAARTLASGRLPRPAAVIYNSHAARYAHESAGYPSDRGHVVHNGIEVDAVDRRTERQRLHETIGRPDDRLVAIRVGRANAQKDHVGLLAAWAALPTDLRARLVLVGPDVPDHPTVARAVADAHPDRPVHALPSRRDARALVGGADLAVSNSVDGESFPTVVAEALAVGTPVVATLVGDTALILDDERLLVAPGDRAGLTAALTDFLRQPWQVERRQPWTSKAEAAGFTRVWVESAGHGTGVPGARG